MSTKHTIDRLGLTVTAPPCCANVIDQLAESILLLLQFDGNPVGCSDAVMEAGKEDTASPQCAMALCMKTQLFASVMLEMDTKPLEAILENKDVAAQYEAWELKHIEMVIAFAKFEFEKAMTIGEAALIATPQDIFTTRVLFVTYFLTSQMDRMRRNLGGLVAFYKHRPELKQVLPYIYGMAAFAYEETGNPKAALAYAHKAIELVGALNEEIAASSNPSRRLFAHPYAMHVICHCYLTWQEPRAGLEAVAKLPESLWVPTQHLVVHCWWHLAVFHNDLGEPDEALKIYDKHMLQHVVKDDPYALSDASGLLFRMYIDGTIERNNDRLPPLTEKWSHWVPEAGKVPRTFFFPFFDYNLRVTQLLVASEADKADVENAIATMTPEVDANPDRPGAIGAKAIATAAGAFLNGDAKQASSTLDAARSMWGTVGGSNGQRDVLQRLSWYLQQSAIKSEADTSARKAMAAPAIVDVEGMSEAFSENPHFAVVVNQFKAAVGGVN